MKNQFFSKSQNKVFQSNCFTKTHFMILFRMRFWVKDENSPILRKVEKHLFSNKKTIIFVAVFEKNQIFERKIFSQTFIFRLSKQSSFIHSLSLYPIFWTKTELICDFYQKTCFLPFLPPISLYKSTHIKILAKRGKSVSLEFQYGAACKKLGNSDLQFSRTRLILHEKGKR